MSEPDIRCTSCGAEFSSETLGDASACPTCSSTGVPMAIKDDVTISINTHELRILTIWADNYAQTLDTPSSRRSLGGILHRLRKQLPGVPLTLSDEFQQLADATGSLITASGPDGVKGYEPKKPN